MKRISIIISTFNREEKLAETVRGFSEQTIPVEDYEIVVVDNGSKTPARLPKNLRQKNVQLIRFETNQERSKSRNTGAEVASGEFLAFSDDDMIVRTDFLEHHLLAHQEWNNLLAIGKIILPPERINEPGIRFRQNIELNGIPDKRGLVSQPNFGTAANMSIKRDWYQKLGGFDLLMAGIEDQDLSMRHTKAGGRIAYLPEAAAIHDDDWLDFLSFCHRQERGMEWTVAFSRRYPDWKDSVERELINGHLNLSSESLSISAKKIIKSALGNKFGKTMVATLIKGMEIYAPQSTLLNRLYRLTLGIYVQKGYRRGIQKYRVQ